MEIKLDEDTAKHHSSQLSSNGFAISRSNIPSILAGNSYAVMQNGAFRKNAADILDRYAAVVYRDSQHIVFLAESFIEVDQALARRHLE